MLRAKTKGMAVMHFDLNATMGNAPQLFRQISKLQNVKRGTEIRQNVSVTYYFAPGEHCYFSRPPTDRHPVAAAGEADGAAVATGGVTVRASRAARDGGCRGGCCVAPIKAEVDEDPAGPPEGIRSVSSVPGPGPALAVASPPGNVPSVPCTVMVSEYAAAVLRAKTKGMAVRHFHLNAIMGNAAPVV